MIALDRQLVDRRLHKLQQVIARLERKRPRTPEELVKEDLLSDATFYRLQIGIEAVIDIGGHILAEVYQRQPESYKDIILALGKEGVVPEKFAEENAAMVDFRNIVVHHYVDIDPQKAFTNIDKAPRILRRFAEYFVEFLEK